MSFLRRNRSYGVWAGVAFFYFYQFIIRVSPGVMLGDLMRFYHLNASEVGTLASLALYSYALFQIPSGVLVDLYGVRKVVLVSLFFCISGTLIFVATPFVTLASLGRVLLGTGSAAAFLCVSKVSVDWFPLRRRSLLLGSTMAIGTLGALNGSAILAYFVQEYGWRESLLGVSILGGFTFAVCFLFLKDLGFEKYRENHAVSSGVQENRPIRIDLIQIIGSRFFWMNTVAALGIYLSISVIADLWGVSYLMDAYSLKKNEAAQITSLVYLGLCFGSLIIALLSEWVGSKRRMIQVCLGGLLFVLYLLLKEPEWAGSHLGVCFFMLGFFAGAETLCFSNALESFHVRMTGTLTGFMNCVVMLGGALIQQQIGRILDGIWTGELTQDGIRLYTGGGYRLAFSLVFMTIVISAVASSFLPGRRRAGKWNSVSEQKMGHSAHEVQVMN